ncbi:MAG TPA: IclR family transcriptional regulator [Vitreimonas sp.]|jgi:DNA-binding IclR family transcriptional regulator|nr:IclR family transcriptional regulator [Vitreimonas sp.]
MASSEATDREHNKATARILRVLSTYVSEADDFGVSELNQRLGMTKNMVHRALTTLAEQGYLIRNKAGRYELGYRILELQNLAQAEPDFRALAAPFMRQLYELTGESVSLAVRADDFTVFIDAVETRKLGAWRTQIGALRPLHASASGRVILSSLPDADVDSYIERRSPMRLTRPTGVMKPADLWRSIQNTRQRGYEIARRGANPVMVAAAFPIGDSEGGLHGVIAVGGPEERFDPESPRLAPTLHALVDDLRARTKLYAAESA